MANFLNALFQGYLALLGRTKCVWSAWLTLPTRWTTPAGSFSGAARERGTSSPPAYEERAF
ncbi:hypothetical protein FBR02_20650 [Anaerolineae bacterium CFX9]|nr:hypothetical protein [Anaerolineae bacterium CFX9]